MKQFIPDLKKAKNIREICILKQASKWYFEQWSLPSRYNWAGRHGKSY
jgi:hypothetical protein